MLGLVKAWKMAAIAAEKRLSKPGALKAKGDKARIYSAGNQTTHKRRNIENMIGVGNQRNRRLGEWRDMGADEE